MYFIGSELLKLITTYPCQTWNMTRLPSLASESSTGKDLKRITIPEEMVPEDAQVEMKAKVVAGYFTDKKVENKEALMRTKGRDLWLYITSIINAKHLLILNRI